MSRTWLAIVKVLALTCLLVRPARAEDRLYAEPRLNAANPYQPFQLSPGKLPVALRGFSAVALQDRRQWISGQEQHQLIFDGQLYWFAEPRDRDIFAAAPYQYAPVLGGDCIVTYVETGERKLGEMELGLMHAGRTYFFAGEGELRTFRADPARYANGDLANDGSCIVTQVDEGKRVVGLPATVAMVNGLRYLFAGDYERRLFASDPGHYGVKRVLEKAPESAAAGGLQSVDKAPQAASASPSSPQSAADELEGGEDQHYAMDGFCPVSIQEQGVWVRGNFQVFADYEGQRYLLAGEKEKTLFAANPKQYAPVLGGDCVVAKIDDHKQAPGSVYHSLIFEGRLYLFAGVEEVKSFKADPTKYLESASPPAVDKTPPVPAQEDASPAEADTEKNVLREGSRSEFRRRRGLR